MRQNLKLSRARLAGILSVALLAAAIPLSVIGTAQADTIPSQVSIKWNENRTLFKGKVRSEDPECLGDRRVTVFKKRPGKDKKVGSDFTNNRGKWKVDKRQANGRYYARVAAKQLSGYYGPGDKCARARSRTIRV